MAAENGSKSTASASVGQGLSKLNVDTGSEKVASFLPDAAAAAAAAAAGAAKGKVQVSAVGCRVPAAWGRSGDQFAVSLPRSASALQRSGLLPPTT